MATCRANGKNHNTSEHHAEQGLLRKMIHRHGRIPRHSIIVVRHRNKSHCSMPCSGCTRRLMQYPSLLIDYIDNEGRSVCSTPSQIHAHSIVSRGARLSKRHK